MALTGTGSVLGSAIWEAIKAQTGATYSPEADAAGLQTWVTISNQIVSHIVANATVTPTSPLPLNVANLPVQVNPATGTGIVLPPGLVLGEGKIL